MGVQYRVPKRPRPEPLAGQSMEKVGRYELLEELGTCGLATVYRARDIQMDRQVALRILAVDPVENPTLLKQFRQEALTFARLQHAHIATVYDFGQADDKPYLAIRLVKGKTLRRYLAQRKRLTLEDALPILAQLAGALDYLKAQKLVYPALDPTKVMLEGEDEALQLTLTDLCLVPEVVMEGRGAVVSPVYIVAATAFEMLAGRPPFEGELTRVRADGGQREQARSRLTPGLDEDVATVLLPGQVSSPMDRYSSAGALVTALQSVAGKRLERARQGSEIAQMLAQAREAHEAGQWLKVQELTVQILQRDQTQVGALMMMAAATAALREAHEEEARQRQLAQWYEEGKRALEAVRRFLSAFENVLDQSTQAHQSLRAEVTMPQPAEEMFDASGEAVVEMESGVREGSDQSLQWLDELAEQKTMRLTRLPTHQLSRKQAQRSGRTRVWEKDGKEMVRIATGGFLYGSDNRSISLDVFWIDKTPVTNAEYKRFLDANPDYPVPYSEAPGDQPYNWNQERRSCPAGMADYPVVLVSWWNAEAYAQWAGKRLPTEQEWEKAARGLSGRVYPWGAWRWGAANTSEAGIGHTTAVGRYSPGGDSDFGCVDMSGNVWEWIASDYDTNVKVLRGGSWCNNQFEARCTERSRRPPDAATNYIGLRLVSSEEAISGSAVRSHAR